MKHEFVTCACVQPCCVNKGAKVKIGKTWASALAGFVAGAIVATIILLPWMVFQSELVESDNIVPNPNMDTMEIPGDIQEESSP